MSQALVFLAETDGEAAARKAFVARCEYACKLARARMFIQSDRTGVEAKKADAEQSHDVQQAEERLAGAIMEFEKVKAKRATEELIVEVWRSVNANRRQGNV